MWIDNQMIALTFKIGFVFTNFNNSKVTQQAIDSISLNDNFGDSILVIVDNKSDTFNVALLKEITKNYINVKAIYYDKNVGYFQGLNIGIQYLRENMPNVEYMVIGNNDLLFPKNFMNQIYMKHDLMNSYPVISPNIITLDGIHQNPHVISKISKVREIIYDLYFIHYFLAIIIERVAQYTKKITDRKDELQHATGQAIYQGYGACYIIGPLFFKYFDLLWAPTFLMGEELFLSRQLESKNLKVYYEPSIVVNHQCHSTMGKMTSKEKWKIAQKAHKVYRKYVKIWN